MLLEETPYCARLTETHLRGDPVRCEVVVKRFPGIEEITDYEEVVFKCEHPTWPETIEAVRAWIEGPPQGEAQKPHFWEVEDETP